MKAFAVNYPKNEADENKICLLRDSYNEKVAETV
jgi:hypothetical protein